MRMLALTLAAQLVAAPALAAAVPCPPATSTQMTLPAVEQPRDFTLWQMNATHCSAFRGCPGTQFGRAMVEDGFAAAIDGVMALVDDVSILSGSDPEHRRRDGACAAEVRQHAEGLYGYRRSVKNTFDRTHPYNDPSDAAFSGWFRKDQADCDNYGKVLAALRDAHTCLLSSERARRACATSLLAKADTLFVAALTIAGGACVELPATDPSIKPFPRPVLAAGARAQLGKLEWKCRDGKPGFDAQQQATPCRTLNVAPRSAAEQAAFEQALAVAQAVHDVHTEQVCGHHVDPAAIPPLSLDQALLAVMGFARTEAELLALRTWPFARGVHPTKSVADDCTLLRMASDDWRRAREYQRVGDQRLSERYWKAHSDDHTMRVLPSDFPNYWVTLPWDARRMEKQDTLTMAQAIARYREQHPDHVEELKHLREMH